MTDRYPFLASTAPSAPQRLLDQAASLPRPRVALVDAGAVNPMEGVKEAADAGFAEPILIGDRGAILGAAEEVGYDIHGLRIVEVPSGQAAAERAAELARDGEADAVMKGHIHTADFLKGLLPSRMGLRAKDSRCGHVFHLTAPGSDRPLLLTDGALNEAPDVATRQACLGLAVELAGKLGVTRPKAALLAPAEHPTPGIQSTFEAVEIAEWARTALPQAEVAGPMAMDLILSTEAAAIKKYDSPVAGDADIISVPEIISGNALFKMMVLGMGCCAAGIVLGAKVPILLTSRSQGAAARIASAALGVVAAHGSTD